MNEKYFIIKNKPIYHVFTNISLISIAIWLSDYYALYTIGGFMFSNKKEEENENPRLKEHLLLSAYRVDNKKLLNRKQKKVIKLE